MKKHICEIEVILAGILWGVISIFIKKLSAAGIDALQISLVRLTVASVALMVPMLIIDRSALRIRLKDIWMFVGTGIVSVTLFNTCYFYTMINSQASIAVVLLYTSPVFIMIFSAFLFKEKITRRKLIAAGLTFAGCMCVTGVLEGGLNIAPFVLFTGICSGLFYGLYTIFGKYALKKYGSLTVTAYTFLFGMLGSLLPGRPGQLIKTLSAEPSLIPWCIGIGIVSTVLPYLLYTHGLKGMESGTASILVAVEPPVGAVIGMTVYGEPRSLIKIAGIVLIMGAIVLLNLRMKAKINNKQGTV